jgi:hypothetical protein
MMARKSTEQRAPALGRQIEAAFTAHRHPFCRAVKVQPERVAVVIAEFVFDVDSADPAATSVAHRTGPTTHFQFDWVLGRQGSTVELAADHVLESLRVHDRAAMGEQLRCHRVKCSTRDRRPTSWAAPARATCSCTGPRPETIVRHLGHQDVKTTMICLHVPQQRQEEEIGRAFA